MILLLIIPVTDIILPNQSCLAVCEWSGIGYLYTSWDIGAIYNGNVAAPRPVHLESAPTLEHWARVRGNVYQSNVIFSPAHATHDTRQPERVSFV